MKFDPSLDLLETDVLSRIAAHRQAQKNLRALPVMLLICFTALAGGWLTGWASPHHKAPAPRSEAALLADDVSLAPSSLLASNH
jgi:hypothetical protein